MRLVLVSLGLFTSLMFGQPTIATTALPNPIVGRALSGAVWTMTASGGVSPYTWAVSSGSLPAGLALSATGAFTGTAASPGAATFTIQVTDSASTSASQSYTITVQYAIGIGCTTATIIDHDCDYYGAGSAIGPDADDTDPTVNTAASMLAKYGTLNNFLSTVKGYNPLHIWYLDPAAGNDSTCVANNVALPCKTWGATHGKIAAGDAIIVRAGVIDENANYTVPHSGTPGNPTIVMGYPGELAHFDHSSPAGWYGFEGQPVWMIFDGILLTSSGTGNSASRGFNLSGAAELSHVTIRNFEIHDCYDGIWAISGSDNVLIENNLIHDDAGEHNIYVGQSSGSSGHMAGMTVRGNILYNCGRDNFHDNGICDSCILTGNILYSANMAAGGGSANISMQNGWNHGTISNNIVFNASAYALLLNAYNDPNPTITAQNANYNLIANNTIIHTGYDASGQNLSGDGFTTVAIINAGGPTIDLGNNTYENNVFIEAGTKSSGLVRYEQNTVGDLNWLSTDTWTNNVMYASNGAIPIFFGLGLGTAYNWAYFQSNAGVFTNNSQANPNLVAWKPVWWATPSLFDLAPQAGSPVIGVGLSASAPSTDIAGLIRNNPPDIGAYQFAGATLTTSTCDLNSDGVVNVLDVVLAVNQVIGVSPCTNANLGSGACTLADVQVIVNAAMGGACVAQ